MLTWTCRESWARDTPWPQRAGAARTAMLRPLKTKMVSRFFIFVFQKFQTLALPPWASDGQNDFDHSYCSFLLLFFHSEEKIWCRFEVQQPHEHWQEENLVVREPGEMCGHLRWAEVYCADILYHAWLKSPKACTDCHSGALISMNAVTVCSVALIGWYLCQQQMSRKSLHWGYFK